VDKLTKYAKHFPHDMQVRHDEQANSLCLVWDDDDRYVITPDPLYSKDFLQAIRGVCNVARTAAESADAGGELMIRVMIQRWLIRKLIRDTWSVHDRCVRLCGPDALNDISCRQLADAAKRIEEAYKSAMTREVESNER